MSNMLKVGVIGVGGIARTHMPGWEASTDAEVTAGADLNNDLLHEWAQKWNVSGKLTSNIDDVINDPDIDIIDICTPSAFHAPLSIAALKAGKHVICEKPLAPTPDEIRQMIQARDESGKKLMTAQHFRFQPTAIALKKEIESGTLGDIYHARSWMLRRAAVPIRMSFLKKETAGGGPCIDIGVHILDLTLWMMGNPKPVSVTGVSRQDHINKEGAWSVWGGDIPKGADVEDFASAFVRFENGASLILEVSWMLHHNTGEKPEDMQMWLYGQDAGSHWPSCRVMRTSNETQQMFDTQLLRTTGDTAPHAAECIAFAKAVANDEPSPVPAEQSLDVQLILDGIYRSSETKREVVLA